MTDAAWRDLEAVYAELQAELDGLRPKCELSGRCCRFKDYGHQLWTTRLELEYLISHEGLPREGPEGVCPYLKEGRCGVRDHRMLGCRVFYCDAGYKDAMGPVYEKHHRKIRELHARHGLPYECFEFLGAITSRSRSAGGPATASSGSAC